ncbi:hypothetical protein L1987_76095 [Smallanthus sonchifolius]|uniref:Uncharacterized protein n=1 Tax=Smallanthus sonchifolius TaxID=185202 RepID=A0ACB9A8I8_9ASTR|nr:hypothetical protein L1987_76095 [Smallanthus sonchifolius]
MIRCMSSDLKLFVGGRMLKHDNIEEESETEPFSLIIPKARTNLVFDRWRNISFSPQQLGSGIVLFKNYLTLMGQVDIVNICQKGAMGPGGFYQPRNPSGDKLRLHMMCFGRNWDPVTRYEKRYRSDGSEPPPLPYEFISLAENAIQDAHPDHQLPPMCPDICLANFYTGTGRLALHQDRDESSDSLRRGLPVVSISIGDTAEFLYGHTNDENKLDKVLLESGDVLIFGGKSRHIFHGVRRISPDSAPHQFNQESMLRLGRLASSINDTSLREAFSAFGEVSKARVIKDRETGRSRGFGFVSFVDPQSYMDAIISLDQWLLHGQTVSLCLVDYKPHNVQLESETGPFSLILPDVGRNLVSNRWRNVVFSRQVLGSGMVLFKNYLTLMGQVEIVNMCNKWGGGFYQPSGVEFGPRMMCFGRNWDPVTRYKKRYTSDGSEPPTLPYHLVSLAKHAIQDTACHVAKLPSICPDICLVNFYSTSSRLGLHQDHDESSDSLKAGLPVVSISIGDSAEFLYGHTRDESKLDKLLLESGDVLVFGGKSRLIFHGVNRILPHSSPEPLLQAIGLRPGRLNLTLRQFSRPSTD